MTRDRRVYKKWTAEDEQILRDMWPTKYTALAIAIKLNRSKQSVAHKAQELGLIGDKRVGNRNGNLFSRSYVLHGTSLDSLEEFLKEE